jgi:hypothetical protein
MVRIWVEKNRIERGKGKYPQSQTLAKMRHLRTYLGLPMPDPTSSEFEKGTWGSPAPTLGLTGSGSRIRASQHDCLMMARSPSGKLRPPTSRCATALLLRPVATSVASLARVETEAGKETNELGFAGKSAARWFCSRRESCMTVHRRWTAHSVLGRMWPRRAMSFAAQAFAAFWDFARAVLGRFSFLGAKIS